MNAEVFAEWLRRQGYRVVGTPSSYWYEVGPHVYQAFPYHWVIQPTEDELSQLLRQNRAIGLRYSTLVAKPTGCISYHAVYDQPSYTLDDLDRRTRQNVRLGLENCHIEPISFERLAKDGWLLEMDTLGRQGRRTKSSEETWRKRYMGAADLPGFEAWGALVEGRLVASLLTFQMEDCCEMISQQCHRDYMRARVNNALCFVVTQAMVSRTGIRSIFYALHSLDAPASVDEFKFRMGYVAKPVRQRVVFHPWLTPVFNRSSHAVVKQLLRWRPDHSTLPKLEGMLRFYLEGKRPLDEQNWPECLTHRKKELLEDA
jgi:hypothetical protein